jgi:hypothetical protein
MNVRIQTYGLCPLRSVVTSEADNQKLICGTEGTAFDALEKGLDDLMDLCDVVAEKFAEAREEFVDKETA